MRFTNIDVNEKVNLFNKNITLNYILHKTITCDGRDPPWINKNIKELIYGKNQAYKSYRQNKNNIFYLHQLLQSKFNSFIGKSKFYFYVRLSKKLSDPMTSPKSYFSILKTLLNNENISYKMINSSQTLKKRLNFFLQNNVLL